jgi:very-short-patch-repair endonuclease
MDTTKIIQLYVNEKLSINKVSEQTGISEGIVKRYLKKMGLTRTKGEAQAIALEQGRSSHPTEGKKATETTKAKMSTAMRKAWVDLPQEEKDKRAEQSSVRWQNMDAQTKANILSKAAQKVRETSKNGSKLEKYIVEKLQDNGYYVLQHVKHTFSSSELEMDMMLPAEKIVIEIDGPSHFLPLYGEEVLQKRQAADARKSGMIINEGWKMVRVCYKIQNTTKYWFRLTEERLLNTIKGIVSGEITSPYVEVNINE